MQPLLLHLVGNPGLLRVLCSRGWSGAGQPTNIPLPQEVSRPAISPSFTPTTTQRPLIRINPVVPLPVPTPRWWISIVSQDCLHPCTHHAGSTLLVTVSPTISLFHQFQCPLPPRYIWLGAPH